MGTGGTKKIFLRLGLLHASARGSASFAMTTLGLGVNNLPRLKPWAMRWDRTVLFQWSFCSVILPRNQWKQLPARCGFPSHACGSLFAERFPYSLWISGFRGILEVNNINYENEHSLFIKRNFQAPAGSYYVLWNCRAHKNCRSVITRKTHSSNPHIKRVSVPNQ